jgi:TPR repeat protein
VPTPGALHVVVQVLAFPLCLTVAQACFSMHYDVRSSKLKPMFRTSTIALISALSFSNNALAGPFEEGTAAMAHGDYSNAQHLLRPLAEQGNPQAQLAIARMFLGGTGV